MTTLWVAILGVALASAAIKALGPVLVGGKELPPSADAVIALLAPALLTALVVTETFGEGGHLVLDEKAVGVGVAALALALRAPVLLAVALAALTTALGGWSVAAIRSRTPRSCPRACLRIFRPNWRYAAIG
jgi:branched-subunit amino acid transport protein